jgi:hypothetical protein
MMQHKLYQADSLHLLWPTAAFAVSGSTVIASWSLIVC